MSRVKIKSLFGTYCIDTKHISYLKGLKHIRQPLWRIGINHRYLYKIGMINKINPIEIIIGEVLVPENENEHHEPYTTEIKKLSIKSNKEFSKIEELFLKRK